MKTDRRSLKLLLAPLLVPLVAAGLLWLPATLQKKRLSGEIVSLQAQSEDSQAITVELEALRQQQVQIEQEFARSDRYLPDDVQLASLLSELDTMIESLDLEDPKIAQIENLLVGADYNVMPLSVKMKGHFVSVFDFLRHLESLPRLTRITHLELEAEDGEHLGRGRVRLDMTLDAFAAATQ